MSKRYFGFHQLTLEGPSIKIGLAAEQITALRSEKSPRPPVQSEPSPKLYAFSVPKRGGVPRVGEYENTQPGHRELASLIRGENVLSVVLGRQVSFEHASVVQLTSDDFSITEKQILPE